MRAFYLLMRLAYFVTWPLTGLLLHNSERVRVLVLKGDLVLLQKTSYGRQAWSLPGGGVDRSESYLGAAARELAEEAGVHVERSKLRLIGKKRMSYSRFGWPKSNITFFDHTCSANVKLKITRPFEITAADWFPVHDLPVGTSEVVYVALELHKSA